jgi:CheY-like chemotaxis protein
MEAYKHIILADDDIDDIESFQSAVAECQENIKVATAEHGVKLIDLLENEPLPDIVVLDLNMPLMNGFECLKAIRQNKRYDNLPILILSTSTSQKDIDYCLANGASYYVVKPESPKALTRLVKDLCTGKILNHFSEWE